MSPITGSVHAFMLLTAFLLLNGILTVLARRLVRILLAEPGMSTVNYVLEANWFNRLVLTRQNQLVGQQAYPLP